MPKKDFKISEIGDYDKTLIDKGYLNETASANLGYTRLLDALKGKSMSEEERMKLVNEKFYGDLEKQRAFYNELANAIVNEASIFVEERIKGQENFWKPVGKKLKPVINKYSQDAMDDYTLSGYLEPLLATGKFDGMDTSSKNGRKLVIKKVIHGDASYQVYIDDHARLFIKSEDANKTK